MLTKEQIQENKNSIVLIDEVVRTPQGYGGGYSYKFVPIISPQKAAEICDQYLFMCGIIDESGIYQQITFGTYIHQRVTNS